jgi:hypothetical protein
MATTDDGNAPVITVAVKDNGLFSARNIVLAIGAVVLIIGAVVVFNKKSKLAKEVKNI